jgi:2-polyprenyl-3-methyl-5-hydroxy-6-metoxy-1,4-benzoquinol methylase
VLEYSYSDATCWSNYLWPTVRRVIEKHAFRQRKAFDLGCGNGSISNLLSNIGFQVIGVDPSESAIRVARENFPHLEFEVGSAYDNLAARYGRFPLVVSLEVVEHCYAPRQFATTLHALLEDDGVAIVSTPYHGYVKNLALAVIGKWHAHLNPLWDGGHIKFFSIPSLQTLLAKAGFKDVQIIRVGRVPLLAKSMIAIARA